ncbi:MAG: DUF3883 domain-containing protein [Parvibaculaceae bacterium]
MAPPCARSTSAWRKLVPSSGCLQSYRHDRRPAPALSDRAQGWERTPFHVTRNELAVADTYRDVWLLVRLWDFARAPQAFELRSPLEVHVALMAISYQASFP